MTNIVVIHSDIVQQPMLKRGKQLQLSTACSWLGLLNAMGGPLICIRVALFLSKGQMQESLNRHRRNACNSEVCLFECHLLPGKTPGGRK